MKTVSKDYNKIYLERYLQLTEVKNFIKSMEVIGASEVTFIIDSITNEHYFSCYHNGSHDFYPTFRIELPF